MAQSGDWQPLPRTSRDVFRFLLDTIDGGVPLDPPAVTARLAGTHDPGGGYGTLAKVQRYDCARNERRLPSEILALACAGAASLKAYVYAEGEARDGGRPAPRTQLESHAYLGDFLRSAPSRRLRAIDLNKDAKFMAGFAKGHLPPPMQTWLIVPDDPATLMVITAFTSPAGEAAGDRVMTISIFSRG
ncbi:MAG: hypothetical protein ABIW83_01035 [Allosphingosinicella sp.]